MVAFLGPFFAILGALVIVLGVVLAIWAPKTKTREGAPAPAATIRKVRNIGIAVAALGIIWLCVVFFGFLPSLSR